MVSVKTLGMSLIMTLIGKACLLEERFVGQTWMNAAEAMGESESWILNEMSFSKKLCCASAKM